MVGNKGQVAKVQLSALILAPDVNVLIIARSLYVMHVASALRAESRGLASVVLS